MLVTTQGGGYSTGLGLSSGSGLEPIDERIHKFITSEITSGIIDVNPMVFGTIKEGIMGLLDERLGDFWAEIAAVQLGAWTLSFREFKACGAPEFFGVKDPIASRRWIADMENA